VNCDATFSLSKKPLDDDWFEEISILPLLTHPLLELLPFRSFFSSRARGLIGSPLPVRSPRFPAEPSGLHATEVP